MPRSRRTGNSAADRPADCGRTERPSNSCDSTKGKRRIAGEARETDAGRGAPERLVLVGEFGRAHGIRGEVRLKSHTSDPAAVAAYGPLQTERGEALTVTIVRPASGGARDVVIVVVDGVQSREAAEALNGVKLYLPRDRLPPIAEQDAFYHADLVGLRVEDPAGAPLGTVVALHDFGAGDVIEIAPAGGGPTAMVAFTDRFVPSVDLASGRLVVDAPDLFDRSEGA